LGAAPGVLLQTLANQYSGNRLCHAGTEHQQQAIRPITTVVAVAGALVVMADWW
jgi:hypothetical protein